MAEYISRDDLLEKINRNPAEHHNERCAQILEAILEAPTAEVEPVRHGDWKWVGGAPYCSACDEAAPGDPYDGAVYTTSRCPNCGARMDGGTENG